jgi:predicted Rossmann-fold nucleotide-binding protein
MKFGVYGSASTKLKKEVKLKAREIGREIARQDHTVITGGCPGLPYEAVLGAYELGGKTVGYSPATNLENHVKIYKHPVKGFTDFVFVPKGYIHANDPLICKKYRNVSSVAASDAAIFIDGRTGTMNEFTIAYDIGKDIGILEGSGGIAKEAIAVLLRDIDKSSNSTIIYDPDPVSLVKRLTEIYKRKKKKV